MSTTPLFLFLQMGSDHVSFPGVFVFQHEGFSPPPSLPPSLSLKELGLEALVLHPPPHSPPATGGRYQAALRSPSRPSRRPAAPQELWAHPQPGFTSRAGQARACYRKGEESIRVPPDPSSYTRDSHTGTESESWLCMELSPVSESSSLPGQLLASPRAWSTHTSAPG